MKLYPTGQHNYEYSTVVKSGPRKPSGRVQVLWERVNRFLRKALLEVADLLGLTFEFVTSAFFWTVTISTSFSMYVWVMAYVAYVLHINAWVTIIPPLVPMTLAWYYIVRRRARNYLALLLAPHRTWDQDKALTEFLKLLEEQKH